MSVRARAWSWPVRAAAGLAIGLAIIVALLRLRAEGRSTRGVLDTAAGLSPGYAVAAVGCELLAYAVPPAIMAVLVRGDGVGTWAAARIALAAIGVGNLVPGQPAPETAITYRELRLRGVGRRRAVAAPLVMLVAVPAVAMALLAGPTLLAAAALSELPAGWRIPSAVAGALALALGAALVATAVSARFRGRLPAWLRAETVLEAMGGPRGAAALIGLALAGFVADAACMVLAGRAVGVPLAVAALPVAYVIGTVAVAVPVLPGGLGAVEVAVPLVFSAASTPFDEAVLAVLAWRVLQFWIPTLAGVGCYASILVGRRGRRVRAR